MAKDTKPEAANPVPAPSIADLFARLEKVERESAETKAQNAELKAQLDKNVKPLTDFQKKAIKLSEVPQPKRLLISAGYEGPHCIVTFAEAQVLALAPRGELSKIRVVGMYTDEQKRKWVVLSCERSAFDTLAAAVKSAVKS